MGLSSHSRGGGNWLDLFIRQNLRNRTSTDLHPSKSNWNEMGGPIPKCWLEAYLKATACFRCPELVSHCDQWLGLPFCVCQSQWAELIWTWTLGCRSVLCNCLHLHVSLRACFGSCVLSSSVFVTTTSWQSLLSKSRHVVIILRKRSTFSCHRWRSVCCGSKYGIWHHRAEPVLPLCVVYIHVAFGWYMLRVRLTLYDECKVAGYINKFIYYEHIFNSPGFYVFLVLSLGKLNNGVLLYFDTLTIGY